MPMLVTKLQAKDIQACEGIMRSLPEWFGIESAIRDYVCEIARIEKSGGLWGVLDQGRLVAFLALHFHNAFTAEIHVMATTKEYHRKGAGRALVQAAKAEALRAGCEFLEVKTLSPSRKDFFYDQTRGFYRAQGFKPLQEFKTLWGEANPCLVMVMALREF